MNKLVMEVQADGVSLRLVRFNDRGGAVEVLGTVSMTREQAQSVGADLVRMADSLKPIDPARDFGGA